MLTVLIALCLAHPPARLVIVDRDNVQITESSRVMVVGESIRDADGNGVIHILGDDITVDFADSAPLRGNRGDADPNTFTGTGIRITADGVTLRNARLSGFHTGIFASDTDRLVIEGCTFDDNFRQRLGSTRKAEDAADWLSPHDNDDNQWRTRYGAAIYVEDAAGVEISGVTVRRGQNGILLDRVIDSGVYDCDCSFLSGWGVGLWRCDGNIISRNALDFCIRGYSHGVYNRGQDSAGLIMFEQCSDNFIFDNSATHGGDGFFCFSGKQALGETPPPDDADPDRLINWYRGRGHCRNIFIGNDCSYAAAHGLELTFGFDNNITQNRFVNNAICGIWGGYSQRTAINGNRFERNGDMPYGAERGGINIEHGRGNWIRANQFSDNACGVFLWWDADEHLATLPWAQFNGHDADRNVIYQNAFSGDAVAVELRDTKLTYIIRNNYTNVAEPLRANDAARRDIRDSIQPTALQFRPPDYESLGTSIPVGARPQLAGRENIVMTEWGPWDHESPLFLVVDDDPASPQHRVELRECDVLLDSTVEGTIDDQNVIGVGSVTQAIIIDGPHEPGVHPYVLTASTDQQTFTHRGVFIRSTWEVTSFASPTDPREDAETWRQAAAEGIASVRGGLRLAYGMGGPHDVGVAGDTLPSNHFGTIARTTLPVPAGTWRLKSRSDDGIRVWIDDELVIDDWTWHPPRDHAHDFTIDAERSIEIRVEHFELDGYAVLDVSLEPRD